MKRLVAFLLLLWATSTYAQSVSAPNDCSGTITVGGTAQKVVLPTASKIYFTFQNLNTTDTMWFRLTGTASAGQGSFALPAASSTAYSSYSTPVTMALAPGQSLSVYAATSTDAFSCMWWTP